MLIRQDGNLQNVCLTSGALQFLENAVAGITSIKTSSGLNFFQPVQLPDLGGGAINLS